MRAGRYRHRVTIQKPERAQDPVTGEITLTWTNVHTSVPAEVLTGAGREFRQSGAVQAETAARINMRWFADLDQSWRVLHDGKAYDIGSVETDATGRREYRLRCTAGVNDG